MQNTLFPHKHVWMYSYLGAVFRETHFDLCWFAARTHMRFSISMHMANAAGKFSYERVQRFLAYPDAGSISITLE